MADYRHVKYAVINIQDPAGKTVGRRRLRDAWKSAMGMQMTVNEVRKSQGFGGLCRKGVFRFRSFEEADAWMTREIVKSAIRRRN